LGKKEGMEEINREILTQTPSKERFNAETTAFQGKKRNLSDIKGKEKKSTS